MMLEIKNLNKNFGGIKALDNCTMSIEKGKITSIIGPNGSGKSTLFNAISNIIRIDSGNIILNNINITALPPSKISKLGISRTFQDVRLFNYLTIKEHMEIAMSKHDEKLLKNLFNAEKINENKITEFLKLVKLNKPLNTLATDLSYGQRKLLDLALAIAKPHDIIMLDEPVAGINPKLRLEIKELIKKLNKSGETIMLIEHDMNFVMDLADEIIVMDAGKVIAKGNSESIQKNKQVLAAYLGE